MLRSRVVPCLLIRDGGLVKTANFKDSRYVGDPQNAIRIFNEKQVDELCVLDIDASRSGRAPQFEMIRRLADQCRMPLAYGGGVRNADDSEQLIQLGVEKVSLGPRMHDSPATISEIAARIGSQSVVVAIDAASRGRLRSGYEVLTHNGTRKTGLAPSELARIAQEAGAGEILLNSVDYDGAMKGYDLDLIQEVRAAHTLPMTVLGGAGSMADVQGVIDRHGPIGAGVGSLFVFRGPYKAVLISYRRPGEELAHKK